jgi:hypothetical protein
MDSTMERPMMDGGGAGIGRTKSEQLPPPPPSLSRTASAETVLSTAEVASLSRKSSFGKRSASGGSGTAGNGRSHIRKSRSAQLKLDMEDLVSSGAALSRASSASLGFSFTFTGFTPPPQHVGSADLAPFSDDDVDDLEAAAAAPTRRRKNLMADPTIPIYLKVTKLLFQEQCNSCRHNHTDAYAHAVRGGEVQGGGEGVCEGDPERDMTEPLYLSVAAVRKYLTKMYLDTSILIRI